MIQALPILPEEEVSRCIIIDEEPGFGTLATPRGHLPLRALDVQARLDGLLAEVSVRQTFVNAFDEPLEATYIFPLPDRAAVTRFRMEVAGRVIEGVLRERGSARREYAQAIEKGHRAAITEEERPGVFTMRVGNLPPGEEATVHLTLAGPLPYTDGEATFRFPLVVAPRYLPGKPLPGRSVGSGTAADTDAVPDGSRITPPVLLPGYPNPVQLSLTVDMLPSRIPLHDFRSSLHAVVQGESRHGARKITLQPGERLNRDFILRYRLGGSDVKTSLSLRPDDATGTEGTFLLTVVPPLTAAAESKPRDVVFVLDRSGSMEGWKMVAARRALARMVDTLTDRDRFTVLAFDDRIEAPTEFKGAGLVPGSDRNRFRAVQFLAGIDSRGGTEMAQPLDLAVRELTGGQTDRDRVLVLVTDGQVGNEDQILRTLGKRARELRIFTLGIDQAVNEAFLKRLAMLGGGCYELVESEDRFDEVMAKVHRRIGSPVLTGIQLDPAGFKIEKNTLVPSRATDLFAGAPLTLLGRYRGTSSGSITVTGTDAAGFPWSERTEPSIGESTAISAGWARGHIRELEDRFVIGGDNRAELEKQIVAISLRFGVLCRFTAYVAVDRAEVVNRGGKVHQLTQPVEMPAGWKMRQEMEEVECDKIYCLKALDPATSMGETFGEDASDVDSLAQALCNESLAEDASNVVPPGQSSANPPSPASPSIGQMTTFSGASMRHFQRAIPKKGGILGKIAGFFKGREGPGSDVPPDEPLDLNSYRQRARQLLEALRKFQEPDPALRLRKLCIIAQKLKALIEDLRTVGAPESDVVALESLADAITKLGAMIKPPAKEIAQLWSQAEVILKAFGGDMGDPGPLAS